MIVIILGKRNPKSSLVTLSKSKQTKCVLEWRTIIGLMKTRPNTEKVWDQQRTSSKSSKTRAPLACNGTPEKQRQARKEKHSMGVKSPEADVMRISTSPSWVLCFLSFLNRGRADSGASFLVGVVVNATFGLAAAVRVLHICRSHDGKGTLRFSSGK